MNPEVTLPIDLAKVTRFGGSRPESVTFPVPMNGRVTVYVVVQGRDSYGLPNEQVHSFVADFGEISMVTVTPK